MDYPPTPSYVMNSLLLILDPKKARCRDHSTPDHTFNMSEDCKGPAIFPTQGMPWPISPPCAVTISAGTVELGGSLTAIWGSKVTIHRTKRQDLYSVNFLIYSL